MLQAAERTSSDLRMHISELNNRLQQYEQMENSTDMTLQELRLSHDNQYRTLQVPPRHPPQFVINDIMIVVANSEISTSSLVMIVSFINKFNIFLNSSTFYVCISSKPLPIIKLSFTLP